MPQRQELVEAIVEPGSPTTTEPEEMSLDERLRSPTHSRQATPESTLLRNQPIPGRSSTAPSSSSTPSPIQTTSLSESPEDAKILPTPARLARRPHVRIDIPNRRAGGSISSSIRSPSLLHPELYHLHSNLHRHDLEDTSVNRILVNRPLPLPPHPRESPLELPPAPILPLDPALTLLIQTSGHHRSLTQRTIFPDYTPTFRIEFCPFSAQSFQPEKFGSASTLHSVKEDCGMELWQLRSSALLPQVLDFELRFRLMGKN